MSQTIQTANPLSLTTKEKRLLYLLAGIQFFNVVDFMIMMPLGPMLSRELGIDTAQFGILVSSYSFAGAAAGLLFALFADRFERKGLLLIIYSLFVLATLSCALAPSYQWLLVARALAGVFGGVLGAMVNTLVADNIAPQRRGQGMAIVAMAFSLSTVLGVPAALWLANHVDAGFVAHWRAPFAAVAFGAALLGVGIQYLLPKGATPKAALGGEMRTALTRMLGALNDPNHRVALCFTVLQLLSSFMVIPYLTIYATRNVAFPESMLWLMYLVGGAVTLFTSRQIGKWADVAGKIKVYRTMAVLSAIPMLAITHVGQVAPWVYLCITTVFFIIVNGRTVPGMALTAGAADNTTRGTFMGLNSCAMSLGLGLGSYLGGHFISQAPDGKVVHFEWAGYAAVTASMAAIWVAGKVKQRA